jgi:2-oxoglutarate/2-oxoacid ferredoxin oxidoreductase subunit alpha
VQEAYDLTIKAFDLAFKYRNPVLVLADAIIGQMKEPVVPWVPENLDPPKGRPGACRAPRAAPAPAQVALPR